MKHIMLGLLLVGTSLFGQYTEDVDMDAEQDVDIDRKSQVCRKMTLNAIKHFQKVSVQDACNDFLRNELWRDGEIFIFVFEEKGACLAHGDDHELIWKNISHVKGVGGKPLIKEMLVVGAKGGSVSYLWNNGFKSSYVKSVKKKGKTYILGAGFFPESNVYATKQLVKTAVAYFNQNGAEATFALISNPKGPFVKGDIYMFAYDFNGINVAHGNNPALVGQNLIDQVDSRGKYTIRALIDVAKNKGAGWVDYIWRNQPKRSYVEKVVDPKTKIPYLISAGYYPDENLEMVKSYVNRAVRYLKANGSKVAFAEFSNLVGEFAQGGLGIFVFNEEGKALAHGVTPAYVGQNLIKLESQGGRFFVKEIIKAAMNKGKALVPYTNFNANAVAYVEFVETPDGKFIIGAEFYPASKKASTQTLVNQAVEYLQENSPEQAFNLFTTRDSVFIRGDLFIFAYDAEGTRLANGISKAQIWKNFMKATDQDGKAVVSDAITVALNGGGWTTYRARNAERRLYVKAVEKKIDDELKHFIVGCGYFR